MTRGTQTSPGSLLVGGDWAIAHGDADGLRHVARELGNCLGGDVGGELRRISQLCHEDYPRAAARWADVRRHASEAVTAPPRPPPGVVQRATRWWRRRTTARS